MRRLSIPTAFAAIALGALASFGVLSACTDPVPVEPSPEPSTTVSAEPTPTGQPTDLPTVSVEVDDDQLKAPAEVDGFTLAEVRAAVKTAQDFALEGLTNPLFLSGAWQDEDQDVFADQFSQTATSGLVEIIAGFDRMDPVDAHGIASIAAVLRDTAGVEPLDDCAGNWRSCLARDVVFSELRTSVEDPDPRLIVEFHVDSARYLLNDNEPAYSDFSYAYKLWMVQDDAGEWKVEAFHNDYAFGELVDGLPDAGSEVSTHDAVRGTHEH